MRTPIAELTPKQRDQAMSRFETLRPYLENNVPLPATASDVGIPLRSARRWIARYRADGLSGLVRSYRGDTGHRKIAKPIIELTEGMTLRKPRSSVTAIHRRIASIAEAQQWTTPSIGSVHAIVRQRDPAMVTLAHEGMAAYRDHFEMIHRHRAERPNAL